MLLLILGRIQRRFHKITRIARKVNITKMKKIKTKIKTAEIRIEKGS